MAGGPRRRPVTGGRRRSLSAGSGGSAGRAGACPGQQELLGFGQRRGVLRREGSAARRAVRGEPGAPARPDPPDGPVREGRRQPGKVSCGSAAHQSAPHGGGNPQARLQTVPGSGGVTRGRRASAAPAPASRPAPLTGRGLVPPAQRRRRAGALLLTTGWRPPRWASFWFHRAASCRHRLGRSRGSSCGPPRGRGRPPRARDTVIEAGYVAAYGPRHWILAGRGRSETYPNAAIAGAHVQRYQRINIPSGRLPG